ncbi:MAG: hypothetical protein WCO94_01930 [Verrucomicrobiota bacterium]
MRAEEPERTKGATWKAALEAWEPGAEPWPKVASEKMAQRERPDREGLAEQLIRRRKAVWESTGSMEVSALPAFPGSLSAASVLPVHSEEAERPMIRLPLEPVSAAG